MELSVLGIVGSPRKNGLTAQVVQRCLEGVAKAGVKTEMLYLVDFHIQPCRDCYPTLSCWEEGKCYHKDDFQAISRKIDRASGLVLGSAVYYGDVTNSVGNLINKKMRHRTEELVEGIPGIGIAVAGGRGGGSISALRRIYHFFRVIRVRGMTPIAVTRFNLPAALDETLQAGHDTASVIQKGELLKGPQRLAAFVELPLLSYDYLQERLHQVNHIIKGAQREEPSTSMKKAVNLYKKAEDLRKTGDRVGAFAAVEEALKVATSIWNPERKVRSG